jgi:hypothetical protein
MQKQFEDKLIESFKKIKHDKYSFDSWVKFNRIKI